MVTDNDHAQMSDAKFTKTFILMMVGFVILTLALIALGNIKAAPVQDKMKAERAGERDALVAMRLVPEGKLNVGAVPVVAAAAPAKEMSGSEVYTAACAACHASGVAGAPKMGDKAAWSDRIAQGMEILIDHAINGYQGKAGYMPPRGGNASLTDDNVKAAIEHMVDGMM